MEPGDPEPALRELPGQKPARLSPLILTEGGGLPHLLRDWVTAGTRAAPVKGRETPSTTMPTAWVPIPSSGYWAKQVVAKPPASLSSGNTAPWALRVLGDSGLRAGTQEDRSDTPSSLLAWAPQPTLPVEDYASTRGA